MSARSRIPAVVLAALLGTALAVGAYERELNSSALRDAYFLGKDTTFRSEQFYKDYVHTFPLPHQGVHVQRIEVITPFREMVDRARRALDGYSPMQAEADYRRAAPPVEVRVRLELTASYPAHSPYNVPVHLGPIYLRDENFWREFKFGLVQKGEIEPKSVAGRPFYTCPVNAGCWLAGADVMLTFDPKEVASRPARVVVLTPDGQRVEAEFDLGKLR